MTQLERIRHGRVEYARYAYRHPKEHRYMGLLEAVNFADARSYLRSGCKIKKVWLRYEDIVDASDDPAVMRRVVEAAISKKGSK
jgi:hypothetical protein